MGGTLPLAVFGPASMGASVRLLAQPAGGELSQTALDAFSGLYYAGWRGSSEINQPFLSFFRLDKDYWGIVRSQVTARREMGDIFVSWLAMIRPEQLEQINWQSHQLWDSPFPETLWLPDTGTAMDPAPFRPVPAVRSRKSEIVEALAFALDTQWEARAKVQLVGEPRIDPDPARVLQAVSEKLGALMAERSYSTHAGIESLGFLPPSGPVDLLVGPGGDASRRTVIVADRPPDARWLLRLKRKGGVRSRLGRLTPADADQVAQELFEEHREPLLRGDGQSVFRLLGTDLGTAAVALPRLLMLAVTALERAPGPAASLIDAFVADALGADATIHIPEDGEFPNPASEVVVLAYQRDLLFELNPATIGTLRTQFFGSGQESGLSSRIRSFTKRRAASGIPLSHTAALAIDTMIDQLTPGAERDALAAELLALLDSAAECPDPRIRHRIAGQPDYVAALGSFHAMRAATRNGAGRQFETRYTVSLEEAAAAALDPAAKSNLTVSLIALADAFTLLDRRLPDPFPAEARQ